MRHSVTRSSGGKNDFDDRGIVRAQILAQRQKPLVKLGAGVDGSGLMLTGDPTAQEWSGIQVLAKPAGSTLRLLSPDGKVRLIKPE